MTLFGLIVLAGLILFFVVNPGVAIAVFVIVAIAYVSYELDKAHNAAMVARGEKESTDDE